VYIHDIIKLNVRLENGEEVVVNVYDTKDYDEDNELIRLLYVKKK